VPWSTSPYHTAFDALSVGLAFNVFDIWNVESIAVCMRISSVPVRGNEKYGLFEPPLVYCRKIRQRYRRLSVVNDDLVCTWLFNEVSRTLERMSTVPVRAYLSHVAARRRRHNAGWSGVVVFVLFIYFSAWTASPRPNYLADPSLEYLIQSQLWRVVVLPTVLSCCTVSSFVNNVT